MAFISKKKLKSHFRDPKRRFFQFHSIGQCMLRYTRSQGKSVLTRIGKSATLIISLKTFMESIKEKPKKDSKNTTIFIVLRVGQTGPFLKNFQLRYSGPVKKLRNGFNKKILQKKIQNLFGLTRNLQKNECTKLRDFLFCNFFV